MTDCFEEELQKLNIEECKEEFIKQLKQMHIPGYAEGDQEPENQDSDEDWIDSTPKPKASQLDIDTFEAYLKIGLPSIKKKAEAKILSKLNITSKQLIHRMKDFKRTIFLPEPMPLSSSEEIEDEDTFCVFKFDSDTGDDKEVEELYQELLQEKESLKSILLESKKKYREVQVEENKEIMDLLEKTDFSTYNFKYSPQDPDNINQLASAESQPDHPQTITSSIKASDFVSDLVRDSEEKTEAAFKRKEENIKKLTELLERIEAA
ncbi:unnamed protein product [Moneuplotes crassus]|uniref:Uncharacterized protein n=1 Tax=Euplotes crassus TaxID=5936 RepID=A0AAD1XPZ2_EUPCR|nr:unnamed protein product [Moneuplotes crassus]